MLREAGRVSLLQLQIADEVLARVPGAYGLHRALFAVLLRPQIEIGAHVDLGEMEMAVGSGIKTADRLRFLVLQKTVAPGTG